MEFGADIDDPDTSRVSLDWSATRIPRIQLLVFQNAHILKAMVETYVASEVLLPK